LGETVLNSDVLDVAIGLFLIFFVFATLTSGVTEGIQWILHQRADFLLRGLRNLLSGTTATAGESKMSSGQLSTALNSPAGSPAPAITTADIVNGILTHPAVTALAKTGNVSGGTPLTKKSAPSYLPSRIFGRVMVDVLTPPGETDPDLQEIRTAVDRLPAGCPARGACLGFITNAQGSVDRFRLQVEEWYDDQMARVSGWFSRRARLWSALIALVIAFAFNINPITISRTLYTDPSTRDLVVAQTANGSQCDPTDVDCITKQVKLVQGTQLPIFWHASATCSVPGASCSWWEAHGLSDVGGWAIAVIGLLLGALAIAMGAPFWFDLLGKVASLRSSGPKPAEAAAPPTLMVAPIQPGPSSEAPVVAKPLVTTSLEGTPAPEPGVETES
jgi:hypothetical protein